MENSADERLRVLHLTASSEIAGLEKQMIYLTRGLLERGVECHALCSMDGPLAKALKAQGVECHILGWVRGRLGATRVIARFLKNSRYDILHVHAETRAAALAARIAGARAVMRIYSMPSLQDSRRGAKRFWLTDRMMHQFVDAYFAPSVAVLREACTYGYPRMRVHLVENGIDLSVFESACRLSRRASIFGEFGLPADAIVVGTVGRLNSAKGHCHLLQAMALLDEPKVVCLVVGGAGGRASELVAQASELGIADRVVFTGHRDDVPHLLGAMDVFAFPSISEGMPNALLEAMAAGLPIVASDIDGVVCALGRDGAGVLVPPGEPQALAASLRLLIEDKQAREDLGSKARARVQRFSIDRMVDATLGVYNAALGRHVFDVTSPDTPQAVVASRK